MNRAALILVASIALSACKQETASLPASEPTAVTPKAQSISGKEAYDQACARCHESGLDGAPRTDHPEDWAGRSGLWQAVLFEHAKKGYMDMPAKGDDSSLDDAVVAAAAEYMLERTHPDLPVD